MPKVSVIIPCYNQGQYVDEAVDSVLAQSFQDFEIIIVNDGSTDDFTNEKLKYYNKAKTRVIQTINQGLAAARNNGFEESSGEFIQFLDADDIILPKKLEKQISVFENIKNIDVCYSNFDFWFCNENKVVPNKSNMTLNANPLEDFLFLWERGLTIPIHCALFRKSIWNNSFEVFDNALKAKEDWVMWVTLSINLCKFHFTNENLVYYRIHDSNMCKNIDSMNYYFLYATLRIMSILDEDLQEKFLKESLTHTNGTIKRQAFNELLNENQSLREELNTIYGSRLISFYNKYTNLKKLFNRIIDA